MQADADELRAQAGIGVVRRSTLRDAVRRQAAVARRNRVSVLVVAMEKKSLSRAMAELLSRIAVLGRDRLKIDILANDVLLHEPVEAWPPCHALIAFYSLGYPLAKVEAYAALHKPFLINDLAKQHTLLDRRDIYATLEKHNVPVPPHVIVSRDRSRPDEAADLDEEGEDFIVVGGRKLTKPFVEKPVDAENHNIYVYFAAADGGGSQHLFRKVKNQSSKFHPDWKEVRRDGSYVYEEFVVTGGTDIKVYAVGTSYAHTEARKSPVVDGLVLRDGLGKEMRYPILLDKGEKEMVRKVAMVFGQNVCGVDILRTRGASYVCDVNGWSFNKTSRKYWNDASKLLHLMILRACAPNLIVRQVSQSGTPSAHRTRRRNHSRASRPHAILRCVIAVIRHGDRTPKEKLKAVVTDPELIALFDEYGTDPKRELKLKTKKQLEHVLVIAQLLERKYRAQAAVADAAGESSGALRKQMKVYDQVQKVLQRFPITGINRKVQLKPRQWVVVAGADGKDKEVATEVQLILKWGGELTALGMQLAERAGERFRETMYSQTGSADDLLTLHCSFRHSLKIYSSDEGRVQMTAAAFTKGLLALEGDLPPILACLVRKDKLVNRLLDDSSLAQEQLDEIKLMLHGALRKDLSADAMAQIVAPDGPASVRNALQRIGKPRAALERLHDLVEKVHDSMCALADDMVLYENESIALMRGRWDKLCSELLQKSNFNISKIPDLYDSIKYDMTHNSHVLPPESKELLDLARDFADIVVPQEYGISPTQKLSVGIGICHSLLEKIVHDLRVGAGKEGSLQAFANEVVHHLDHQPEHDEEHGSSGEELMDAFESDAAELEALCTPPAREAVAANSREAASGLAVTAEAAPLADGTPPLSALSSPVAPPVFSSAVSAAALPLLLFAEETSSELDAVKEGDAAAEDEAAVATTGPTKRATTPTHGSKTRSQSAPPLPAATPPLADRHPSSPGEEDDEARVAYPPPVVVPAESELNEAVISSVRSRFYFTSESHIHSLLNVLRFGGFSAQYEEPFVRSPSVSSVSETGSEASAPSSPTLTSRFEHSSTSSDKAMLSAARRASTAAVQRRAAAAAAAAPPTSADDVSGRSRSSDASDDEQTDYGSTPPSSASLDPATVWQQALSYLGECSELNYLSAITCRLFEIPHARTEAERFFVEWRVSPGVTPNIERSRSSKLALEPPIVIYKHMSLPQMEDFFQRVSHVVAGSEKEGPMRSPLRTDGRPPNKDADAGACGSAGPQ